MAKSAQFGDSNRICVFETQSLTQLFQWHVFHAFVGTYIRVPNTCIDTQKCTHTHTLYSVWNSVFMRLYVSHYYVCVHCNTCTEHTRARVCVCDAGWIVSVHTHVRTCRIYVENDRTDCVCGHVCSIDRINVFFRINVNPVIASGYLKWVDENWPNFAFNFFWRKNEN